MQLVLCVDLDDDLGRKTGIETPVIGTTAVRDAAVALATADPEDSDANVLFEGLRIAQSLDDESAVVAAVTGLAGDDVAAGQQVGAEVDRVIATLETDEEVHAIVVTDGAQDESVLPVIRSRVPIDGVRRVVVKQVHDLESVYYTIKQVLNDPETRGTILIPLGILLLVYPLSVLASFFDLPGVVLGVTSGMLGLYLLVRGFGVTDRVTTMIHRLRDGLYAGRVTIITYLVAVALFIVGSTSGLDQLATTRGPGETLPALEVGAALVYGAVVWVTAAGLTTSLGQITDSYLTGTLQWRYLNAPFYVIAIGIVLYGVSGFLIDVVSLSELAAALTAGFTIGVASTLAFAIAETRSRRQLSSS